MKKLIVVLCLLAAPVLADWAIYQKSNGYLVLRGTTKPVWDGEWISTDKGKIGPYDGSVHGVIQATISADATTTNQCSGVVVHDPETIRFTQEWKDLQTDLDAMTTAIGEVTDPKSKAACNAIKKCINDLKKLVGKLEKYE